MEDASSGAPSVTVSCVRMTSLSTRPAVRNLREKASNVSCGDALVVTVCGNIILMSSLTLYPMTCTGCSRMNKLLIGHTKLHVPVCMCMDLYVEGGKNSLTKPKKPKKTPAFML